jgi:hypothetical protein
MEMAEAKLANAVVVTDIAPATAKPTTRDIRLAFLDQFEFEITPISITRFRSDFIVQFDNPHPVRFARLLWLKVLFAGLS